MLPKSKRLKTADFKALRRAKTFHTGHLFLRTVPAPTWRVAAVVSTAVSPSAVRRNALRRRIYDAVRRSIQNREPNALIAISAKKGAETLRADQLKEELDSALRGLLS